jgi:flagellar motility protein MotE (MotC chaperone)
MKNLINKIIKIGAAVCALNFLLLAAVLLYLLFAGYFSEENTDGYAKVIAGWKVVTPAEYEFLVTKNKGEAALRNELRIMIEAQEAIKAREQRTDMVNRTLADRLERTKQDVFAAMEDLRRKREEIEAAVRSYEEQKKKELDYVASEHFQKQVKIYEGMEPANAAANIYELPDDVAAKYLSMMGNRPGTRVSNEITALENARIAAGTLSDNARRLPKILQLVKEYRSTQTAQ